MLVYAVSRDAVVRIEEGAEPIASLEGRGPRCVSVDAMDPDRVAVGTFDHGLYLSRDGGRTWREAGAGIPHARVLSVAFSTSRIEDGRAMLYAGTEPSGLYGSADDGATWQAHPALLEVPSRDRWSFPPRPWTHHVRAIAPHPTDPTTLLVGIELGGVMRTTDGGASWEDHRSGACIDPHALAFHPRATDRAYETAGDGVAVSDDAGDTWRTATEGMDRTYAWGLAVDPHDPNLWYVSAAPGPGHAHGGDGDAQARLYRRRGEGPWEPLGQKGPLWDRMPYALAAPAPGTLIVGTDDGRILRSRDAGDRWTAIAHIDEIQDLAVTPA